MWGEIRFGQNALAAFPLASTLAQATKPSQNHNAKRAPLHRLTGQIAVCRLPCLKGPYRIK